MSRSPVNDFKIPGAKLAGAWAAPPPARAVRQRAHTSHVSKITCRGSPRWPQWKCKPVTVKPSKCESYHSKASLSRLRLQCAARPPSPSLSLYLLLHTIILFCLPFFSSAFVPSPALSAINSHFAAISTRLIPPLPNGHSALSSAREARAA